MANPNSEIFENPKENTAESNITQNNSKSKLTTVKRSLIRNLYFGVGLLTLLLVSMSGYLFYTKFVTTVASVPSLTNLLSSEYLFDFPNNEKLAQGQLKGLVASLNDPYTEYLPKAEREELTNQLNKQYQGIGVVFDFSVPGTIKVTSVLPESPAKKAGVLEGDILIKVNSEDVQSLNSQEIVSKIRGDEGTSVKITLFRGTEQIEKDIVRAKISADILSYKPQGEVGIITLSSFGDNLDSKMKVIAKQITADSNIKKIVLDVRNDSGGLLSGAVDVLSYFVPRNTVLLKERDKKSTTELKSTEKSVSLSNYPIAVIMNEYSASASEITAGALRDIRGAKLVGAKSFGKGVVQKIYPLSNGDSVKITVAEWLTPNDTRINKKGLEPDIKVGKDADPIKIATEQAF